MDPPDNVREISRGAKDPVHDHDGRDVFRAKTTGGWRELHTVHKGQEGCRQQQRDHSPDSRHGGGAGWTERCNGQRAGTDQEAAAMNQYDQLA